MNFDLHNSAADTSQRMLNAIEPGSVVPIHRHQKTSETVVVLRGRVVEEFYDELERICSNREGYRTSIFLMEFLADLLADHGPDYASLMTSDYSRSITTRVWRCCRSWKTAIRGNP